mgnify:CR=1 FL=1
MLPNNAIRQARKAANIRQTELAAKVGCAQQTIVDIESGKITRSSYLPKICEILGLDLSKVMDGETPDSVIELQRHHFGNPVPVLTVEQSKAWDGSLATIGQTAMLPCPVPHSRQTFAMKVLSRNTEADASPGRDGLCRSR